MLRRKGFKAWWLGAAGLGLLVVVLAVLLFLQRQEAMRQESLHLAALARESAAAGDGGSATAMALEALPEDRQVWQRPYVAEAEAALFDAVSSLHELAVWQTASDYAPNFLSFSPDGSHILVDMLGGPHQWNIATGTALELPVSHLARIWSAGYSPDGRTILTGGNDGIARLFDAATGAELRSFQAREAGYSPDGRTILTGGDDGMARLFDAATGAELRSFQARDGDGMENVEAAFSPDGARIATGTSGGEIRVWDVSSGNELAAFRDDGDVFFLQFSPDGRRLATQSAGDATQSAADIVREWDITATPVAPLLLDHGAIPAPAPTPPVAFSDDGSSILTCCADDVMTVWNAEDGALRLAIPDTDWGLFAPDGRLLTVRGAHAMLRNAVTGAVTATLSGHGNYLNWAEFSADGSIVATASADRTTRLWDARSGAAIAVLRGPIGGVFRTIMSPAGDRIVTVSMDGTMRLWSVRPIGEPLRFQVPDQVVQTVGFSTDGTRIITGSEREARIWDSADGSQIAVLHGHQDNVLAVATSADGRRVITGSADGTARVWDAQTGEQIAVLAAKSDVWSVALTGDGTRAATWADDGALRLWNAENGAEERRIEVGSHPLPVAFSADGRVVMAVRETDGVAAWDVATGAEVAPQEPVPVPRHLSPDGSRGARVSLDRTVVQVFDLASRQTLASLRGHSSFVINQTIAFSPDGTHVAAASADGTVLVWRVFPSTSELIAFARQVMPPRPSGFRPDLP